MAWTAAQQEAIDVRGKNILVSAAAGSGKTAVLVERIKQMILDPDPEKRISVSEMLIVTFTNAAASEMKEKILKAIRAQIRQDVQAGAPAADIMYLKEQLSLIPMANISTFHAFCMEILKKYFYEADVDPDFKICDEGQQKIMTAEAMDELFETWFENDDQEFLEFMDKYGSEKGDRAVRTMISDTYNFIRSMPEPFEWLDESVERLHTEGDRLTNKMLLDTIKKNIISRLTLAVKYMEKAAELASGFEKVGDQAEEDLADLEEMLEKVRNSEDSSGLPRYEKMISAFEGYTFQKLKSNKEPGYESVKDTIKSFRDNAKNQVKKLQNLYGGVSEAEQAARINLSGKYAAVLSRLVKEFDGAFTEKKREAGVIDFNDIEHLALKALDNPDIAEEYRNKFKAIYIDEYQDSNFVQESIVSRICRPDNVFMVGDVKQSIYRFRLAEPGIFIDKYKRYKQGESDSIKIDLNMNFRSKASVINAVNDVFSQLMTGDTAGIEYDKDAALYQGDSYQGPINYAAELHIMDGMVKAAGTEGDGDGDSAGVSADYSGDAGNVEIDEEILQLKSAELQARQVVKILQDTVGRVIHDSKAGVDRTVRNRDIVILLRTGKSKSDIFAKALTDAGIPVYVNAGEGYFDTVEIEVFLHLLRLIDNRKQDISLISVLYSPIFGFSGDDLADIRLANPGVPYYQAFENYSAIDGRCREILDKLAEWRIRSVHMPLEDFIWYLIRETGYMEFVSVLPGSAQRTANLRALADKASAFRNAGMKGLFSFVNYIDQIKKNNVDTPAVKLLGENDDVVRIMTVHKSKGLEFPVVIMPGLDWNFMIKSGGRRGSQVVFHNKIGMALRCDDAKAGYYQENLPYIMIKQEEMAEELAEELRILYVAFTRPKDRLILLGSLKNAKQTLDVKANAGISDILSGSSFLDWMLPILKNTDIHTTVHTRSELQQEKNSGESKAEGLVSMLKKAMKQQDPRLEEIRARLNFVYPHMDDALSKSKFSVSEINRAKSLQAAVDAGFQPMAGPASSVEPGFMSEAGSLDSAAIGTAVHTVMEHVDFSRTDMTEADVKELAADLASRNILTEAEAEAVDSRYVLGFVQSDIGIRAGRAASAGLLHREMPFTLKKDEILIQGIIDCCFQEDGEWVLVDYKTNRLKNRDLELEKQRLRAEYETQAALYRQALEAATGMRVKETYLYSFAMADTIAMN